MTQRGLYRTPPHPGPPGGYLWKPATLGLALLLGVNVIATEFVAHHFDYQRALGAPLVRTSHFALYQPFAWAIWLLKYAGHPNPRIRVGILSGPLIVVTGSVATIVIFAAANLHRTRKLSENAQDLHGSARWATATDIESTGLVEARQGVYVGGWFNEAEHRLHYLRDESRRLVRSAPGFPATRSGRYQRRWPQTSKPLPALGSSTEGP